MRSIIENIINKNNYLSVLIRELGHVLWRDLGREILHFDERPCARFLLYAGISAGGFRGTCSTVANCSRQTLTTMKHRLIDPIYNPVQMMRMHMHIGDF